MNASLSTKAKKMACQRSVHFDANEEFHHIARRPDLTLPAHISQGAVTHFKNYNSELSVENLQYANVPHTDTSNDILMNWVSKCTTASIKDENREQILGVGEPDFTNQAEVKEVAEKFKKCFGERFGMAYLMQGLMQA